MLSSQLAQYGLEALRDGDPYVAVPIKQANIISNLKGSALWEDVIYYADVQAQKSKENGKIVEISILHVDFITNSVVEPTTIEFLDFVTNYIILCFAPEDEEKNLIKVNLALILF